jgi:hypothetical protein
MKMKNLMIRHKTLYGFLKPFLMSRKSFLIAPNNKLVNSFLYRTLHESNNDTISKENLLVHSHIKDYELDNNVSNDNKLINTYFFNLQMENKKCAE